MRKKFYDASHKHLCEFEIYCLDEGNGYDLNFTHHGFLIDDPLNGSDIFGSIVGYGNYEGFEDDLRNWNDFKEFLEEVFAQREKEDPNIYITDDRDFENLKWLYGWVCEFAHMQKVSGICA